MSDQKKPGRPKSPNTTTPVSVRMTAKQHARYIELGGARWLKRLLDEKTP